MDLDSTISLPANFEEILDELPHTVWACDANGINFYQSRLWYEYVGEGPGSSYGQNWLRYYHPDGRGYLLDQWNRSLKDPTRPYNIQVRIRRHDGAYRWFRVQGRPVQNSSGTVTRWVGTCTKIENTPAAPHTLLPLTSPAAHALEGKPQSEAFSHAVLRHEEKCQDRSYSLLLTPIPGRAYLNVYGRDITERKRSEEETRDQRTRLEAVFAAMADGVMVFDANGKVVMVNEAEAKLCGYAAASEMMRDRAHFATIFALSQLDGTPLPLEQWPVSRILRGESLANLELRVTRLDIGRQWMISFSGEPIPAIGNRPALAVLVSRDITEAKAAEEALRRSEACFRASQEASLFGFTILKAIRDSSGAIIDFEWTYANPAAATLLRRPAEALVGHRLLEILPNNHQNSDLFANYVRVVETGQSHNWELRYDGEGITGWFNNMTVKLDDGIAVSFHDITSRKAFETEMERLVTERTARLQEMVHEIEQYSYSISHDMRAPLRAMNQYSQIVLEDFGALLPAEGQGYLQRIIAAATRLDRLIQDVLTYHRMVRADIPLEKVDLDVLARDIIQQYPMFQAREAQIEVATPLLPVRANVAALTQCLSNLLGNAVKFVAPGVLPKVRVWTESRGLWVRVWVEDNGIGINSRHLDRIWGIFQQIHDNKAHEGTGIGLSIVKKAVERMGGRVGVESHPGQGSRFWIELKAALKE